MKASEVKLIALLNRNNAMGIRAEQLVLGPPVVAPGAGHNTWIVAYATAEDKRYNRGSTTRYNRLPSHQLGVNGTIDLIAYGRDHITEALLLVLETVWQIPCEASELTLRTNIRLTDTESLVVYDFTNHPLVFGTITVRATLGRGDLSTVITNTLLSGFTEADVSGKSISDEIKITTLHGFSPADVQ